MEGWETVVEGVTPGTVEEVGPQVRRRASLLFYLKLYRHRQVRLEEGTGTR